jgi:hypothetical protein
MVEPALISLEPCASVGGGIAAEALTHKDAVAVHKLLGQKFGDQAAAEDWRQRCSKVFRWSGFFQGADRLSLGHYLDKADNGADANGVADALQGMSVAG